MRQSKTCGEPCAVCDGCLEAHDAVLKARVAELEELLSEAICYDWEPECPPNDLRERVRQAGEQAINRHKLIDAGQALAGRKEGR